MRLIISILLFSGSLFGQSNAYVEVTYRARRIVPIDYSTISNQQTRNILKGQEEILKDLDFKLLACGNTYFYQYVEDLDLNGASRKAASLAGGTNSYYRNDTIHYAQNESYGEQLNIILKKDRFSDWEITNEKKEILGYTCIKAVAYQDKIQNDLTTIQQRITAWFAPALNFPAGPQGIDELPGLVLEGSVNDLYMFYAQEIAFGETCKEIKEPKRGKIITMEAYNQLIIDLLKLIKSRN
ncbi:MULTISPECIES: GLPGLI family protein [unclassified Leeuwenhoekiella]|uniref:GLPGLI family protein n=1 Tax=unclassified Leeuwenhoekiella TaxID=2615029 RepID=UPI000C4A0C67|nr:MULTISPECIES: GLPGLI family protein [unclassified Leeuwenhoekiella]MAW94451.1 hypothetical protein [Leeuwenhoekiella sp.]MBA81129.1 hypothetical protein [Leeuwenhoekiella sp.]|tara:strand:+ start:56076 stop:56795 length:720 start_codon:yes stop_codon:yes gene_type:complete